MFGIIFGMTVPDALAPGWRERAAGLVRTLQDWPWRDTWHTLGQRFREDRLGLTAGSLTFTTVIALVPLLAVMLSVFAAFPMFRVFRSALERYFMQALVPDTIAKPVLAALNRFATQATGLGSAGLIVLVLTAIALMLTIDRTLNAIWRVRRPRPIAQRVLVYWAAVTLGPLALGISLSVTSYAISASQGFVKAMPGGVALLIDVLEFAGLAAGIAGLYHYVPNTHVRWRHALLGGVFVALGFELAKRLLAWYVRAVPSYATIYGAFATLPIFLVWMYLGWLIVLFGAVVAAYAPSWQMKFLRRPEAPGHRFELAITVLRELALARSTSTHGLALDALAQRLRIDPLQLEPVVDALVALDWVGRLDEGGVQRHVLLADPAATKAQALIAQLLLDPSPVVRGFWHKAAFGELTLADVMERS
jgi:membrane protein